MKSILETKYNILFSNLLKIDIKNQLLIILKQNNIFQINERLILDNKQYEVFKKLLNQDLII